VKTYRNIGTTLDTQLHVQTFFTAHKPRREDAEQGRRLLTESYTGLIKDFRRQGSRERDGRTAGERSRMKSPHKSAAHQSEQSQHRVPGQSSVLFRQRRDQHVKDAVNHQQPKSALIPGQIHGTYTSRFSRGGKGYRRAAGALARSSFLLFVRYAKGGPPPEGGQCNPARP
jgi:hypothetical protein